jgi:hypothetical protein
MYSFDVKRWWPTVLPRLNVGLRDIIYVIFQGSCTAGQGRSTFQPCRRSVWVLFSGGASHPYDWHTYFRLHLLTIIIISLISPFFWELLSIYSMIIPTTISSPNHTNNQKYYLRATTKWITEPWGHVGMFFVGAYMGHKMPQWELKMLEDVNEMRASRGMPPMTGTKTWYGLQRFN